MAHAGLRDLDQFRDQVEATLQLHIDLRERIPECVARAIRPL